MSTFREFQAGFQLRKDQIQREKEDAARTTASALFGGGDYDGAEGALYGAGLYNEGSALAGAGDRRTAKARQQRYGQAYRTGGAGAVRDIAGAEGDFSTAADVDQWANSMDANKRAEAALRLQFIGNAAYGLSQIQDPAQRKQAFDEMVEQGGEAYGITPEQAASFDLSDENLKATYENSLSVADRITMKHTTDREAVEDDHWGKTFGLQKRGVDLQAEELGLKKKALENPPPNINDESQVRREYLGQAKEFVGMMQAYSKVRAARETPAGDLNMIYAIMKMFDPGASVMQGDFANASNASGVPGQIVTMYNNLLKGDKLNPDQRKDFRAQAAELYRTAEIGYESLYGTYQGVAAESGLDPSRVIPDLRQYDFGDLDAIIGEGGGEGEQSDQRKQELNAILFGGY